MKAPETKEEMHKIIEKWTELQLCGGGAEMCYFADEIFLIIQFMEGIE